MRRLSEAYQLCNRVIDFENEGKDDVLLDIAYIYIEHGYFNEAMEWLLKGYKINPKNSDLLFELAFCYEQLDEDEKQ